MTTRKNSRRQRTRSAVTTAAVATAAAPTVPSTAAPTEPSTETSTLTSIQTPIETPTAVATQAQPDLAGQLQRMAAEVGQLQSELAAVRALVTPPPDTSARPGAGWVPSPEPQPWVTARSA